MSSPTRQIKVLSLNCWGLKFVADKRRERLAAIAEWIARSNSTPSSSSSRTSYHSDDEAELNSLGGGYDVVALQEIWVRADFDLVAARAKEAGLLYSRFFYSGAIGAGLGLLSAHPILSAFITPYPLNGHPLHFIEGDFFAGKSVCGITVELADVGKIDILNTHMYAPGGEGDIVTGAHRVAQAWELARIAQEKAERGRHVILMGDLNSQPHSIIIRLLSTHGSLQDAFLQTHDPPPSITSSQHRSLSPLEVLNLHGITCDSPLNTYSAPKLAKRPRNDDTVIRGGKRLDYVLYRSPLTSPTRLVAASTRVVLTEPHFTLGCSLSDHFGLEAVLSFLPSSAITTSSGRPILDTPPSLSTADLTTALSNLAAAHRSSLASSKSQLQLLGAAIVLAVLLALAASLQPLRYLGWLFVILGVGAGAGGATMLYSGFVGGNWEAGALRNVITEMESELQGRRLRD